mmetsp:Transcript_4382/g.10700  ORF Transcript_4382/g.10700 Transcript_4382/m.10700 type:complete len:259 (-) Transcript_4382:42-818(-)
MGQALGAACGGKGTNVTITLGYWDIRGLGAPVRMALEFYSIPYTEQLFSLTMDGSGQITGNSWAPGKEELKATNALQNVPYIVHGETTICQTVAILMYLQKVGGPLSAKEDVLCHQMLLQAQDLRNALIQIMYGAPFGITSPEDFKKDGYAQPKNHIDTVVKDNYDKCNGFIKVSGGPYTLGSKPCVGDMHLWEMVDQHEIMAKDLGFPSPVESFPFVKKMYESLRKEKTLETYFASKEYMVYPLNNKIAVYGAQPRG